MENTSINLIMLLNAARAAYESSQNDLSSRLYLRAAEQALAANEIAAHVHCLRWTGNALMWAFRHNEAYPYLLQAASFENDPRVPPDEIYGTMTDLGLLSIRSRPFRQTETLLKQIREFLERRHLTRWDHRVDRLESLLSARRGYFQKALEAATRAWQRRLAATDGPTYQNGAYLDAIFRAAHQLGDTSLMDQALDWFSRQSERHIVTSRLREKVCFAMRRAFDGVDENNRTIIESLTKEALGVLSSGTRRVVEEGNDAVRLLATAGGRQEANRHFAAAVMDESADSALLSLDLALCQLASDNGWTVPFYRKDFAVVQPVAGLLPGSAGQQAEIVRLFAEAERLGGAEDTRLECSAYADALTVRRRWISPASGSRVTQNPANG